MKILIYILKVWLLSMICAPMLAFAISNPGEDYWYVYTVVLSTSLLLSIPAVLAIVVFLNFAPDNWSNLKIKTINSLIAVSCVFFTFWLMDKDFLNTDEQIILWPLSYSVVMVIFIFIFKLNRRTLSN